MLPPSSFGKPNKTNTLKDGSFELVKPVLYFIFLLQKIMKTQTGFRQFDFSIVVQKMGMQTRS